MSPTSDAIEKLVSRHGVNALEALEYFLERAAIREYDGGMSRDEAEAEALEDLDIWARLWVQLKGDPGPQLKLGGVK